MNSCTKRRMAQAIYASYIFHKTKYLKYVQYIDSHQICKYVKPTNTDCLLQMTDPILVKEGPARL